MKSEIEYEVKSRIESESELEGLVEDFQEDTRVLQQDKYYDTKNRDLFEKGIFLRIRNEKEIEIKYNPDVMDNNHVSCDEYSYIKKITNKEAREISEFLGNHIEKEKDYCENISDIMETFSLEEFVTIKKERRIYNYDKVDIVIDKVDELGLYVEIEAKSTSFPKKYEDWIKENSLSHIPTGYVEMYLKKNEPETYLKGRYLLPEDRDR